MRKSTLKPVLLSVQQIAALEEIQKQERNKSPLDIAPTIHVIARKVFDQALNQNHCSD